jgi:hypothetical protein
MSNVALRTLYGSSALAVNKLFRGVPNYTICREINELNGFVLMGNGSNATTMHIDSRKNGHFSGKVTHIDASVVRGRRFWLGPPFMLRMVG